MSSARGSSLPFGIREMPTAYYESLGRACDFLLRCKDCQRLVPTARLTAHGCCSCGNRRLAEIKTLSLWEYLRIRLGLLRFPYRREFLREFEARS